MIIFANSFLGKSVSIKKLNLQAFEIDNDKIHYSLKEDPSLLESIKNELLSAEKNNFLMSMYFSLDYMCLLIEELKKLNRPLPIIIGYSEKYKSTIKESIKDRCIKKESLKEEDIPFYEEYLYRRVMSNLNEYYEYFKALKIKFPELRMYELENGQYVSDILNTECQDIISMFPGTPKSRLSKIKELRNDYPHIF